MDFVKGILRKLCLIFQLSKANLKISFITLIGLIIAISMISSCLIYSDTQKENSYRFILEDSDFSSGIEFRHMSLTRYINPIKMVFIKQELEEQLDKYGLYKYLFPNSYAPFYSFSHEVLFLNQMEKNSIICFDINNSFLENCIEGSILPNQWNETIIFTQNDSSIDIGDEFILKFPYYKTGAISPTFYVNYTMIISGIVTPSSITTTTTINEELNLENRSYLITNIENYFPFIEELRVRFLYTTSSLYPEDSGTWPYRTTVHFPYKIVKSNLDYNNVVDFVNKLESFFDSKTHTEKTFVLEGVEINLYQNFYTFKDPLNTFNYSLLLFIVSTIPIFGTAFLLVVFSISLINERRKKALVLLKTRGFSNIFIFILLTIESLILAFIASIVGIIIGIPSSILLGEFSGVLHFFSYETSRYFVLTLSTLRSILLIGAAFTILALLPSTIRLSRISDVELAEESSRKKNQRFQILKGNLDVILITQGFLGFGIVYLLMDMISLNVKEFSEVSQSLYILLITLLCLSPLAILIGLLLFYNRFIPLILHYTGTLFWKKDFRLFAIVSRNLAGNLRFTRRTTLLMAISISFLMILSLSSTTMRINRVHRIYFDAGCDVKMSLIAENGSYLTDTTVERLVADLNSLSGLTTTQVSSSHIMMPDDYLHTTRLRILGIEANFAQVAYWKSYFDDNSLEEHVNSLFSSSEEYPVIIDTDFANIKELEIGNVQRIYLDTTSMYRGIEVESVSLTIQGMSNNWPGFYDKSDIDRYMIIPINLLQTFSESYTRSLWCKISENSDDTYVIDQIRNISKSYHVRQESLSITIERIIEDSVSSTGMIFLINLISTFNGLASIILITIAISFFTYIRTTSHTVEIGLSRALGMKFKQIFFIMFTEPFILFLLSGIPGGLIGSFLLICSFGLLSISIIQGIPFLIYVDFINLIIIYFVILIAILLSGLISSLLATRANVSKILKVE